MVTTSLITFVFVFWFVFGTIGCQRHAFELEHLGQCRVKAKAT